MVRLEADGTYVERPKKIVKREDLSCELVFR